MTSFLAFLSISLYGIAAILMLGRAHPIIDKNTKYSFFVALIAALLHGVYLSKAIIVASGQDMSISNVLSLVAWLISVCMLLSSKLLPNRLMLPSVFFFALISISLSLFAPLHYMMNIELHPSIVVHIALSLFAYGVLFIAFLYAIQMAFITQKLKRKGATLINSPLPPLMLIETILFKLIFIGTALLATSLLTGVVFTENMISKEYAHKTTLSTLALFVYLFLLIGQKIKGWTARQVISQTVTGLILLTMAYFGSRFVREIIL